MLHYFPVRFNGQLVPILPAPVTRLAMAVIEWGQWRMAKKV
jgi:hypothetical protein